MSLNVTLIALAAARCQKALPFSGSILQNEIEHWIRSYFSLGLGKACNED
jgi:hypothetical protein